MIRKVPQHTRKTSRGTVTVKAYTARTALSLLDLRSRATARWGPKAAKSINREMRRRAAEGRDRARAIQAYRREVLGRP